MWTGLGFAVSAAYWPGLLTASFAPRWTVIAVGLPLLSRLDPRNLPSSIRWFLSFGMLWAALSLIHSPDVLGGTLDLFTLGLLCVAVIAGSAVDVEPILKGLILGLGISSGLAIAQTMGFDWPRQSAAPAGLFLNREVLAEFAAPLFVWCALKPRLWLLPVPAIPLILCHSRIAVFAAALGLVFAWALRPRPRGMVAAVFLALVAVGVIGLFLRPESVARRYEIWMMLISSLSFGGRGLGWFQATYPNLEFGHSDVLQLLAELGVGAIPFLLVPLVGLWWAARSERCERATLFTCCAICLVSFPMQLPAGGFLLAILSGRLARARPVLWDSARHIGADDLEDFRWAREKYERNRQAVRARGDCLPV